MDSFSEEPPFVMVVDDNSKNLQLIGKILGKEGYSLSLLTNPERAVKTAMGKKPDLILLDVMMPVVDGFEICRSLKSFDSTKEIPVLFVTAKTETDDILKGFDVGGVDYITKPFNQGELTARVRTHIELKKSRDEIKKLRGFLPICANCKKIRDDKGYWEDVEKYIASRSYIKFSHGICPECVRNNYPDIYKKIVTS
ncbi:MAG: response regulator [Deltaproteobacteria bacterium]|nr:MAG: response regulator [Deltaproteobacteria bacterium]